ncbi:SMP-30/gluconolactonase/LRE family protein [Streptomyces sp. NPDC096205]|uniref:SMP-30/gluconolactonase/LRE family protein n=1 Tax=Streptomyces sp. NPDC096205 TaxID=3366081 RepID=UPI0037F88B44
MRLTRAHRSLAALALALSGLVAAAAAPSTALEPETVETPKKVDGPLYVQDAISLPGTDAYPEGMSVDYRNGDTYITSFATGAVYKAPAGQTQAQVWLPAGTDGRTEAMGVEADKNGRIWVCDKNYVTLYDAATKARLARFVTPTPGQSVLNDLDITQDGTAYITDSNRQKVYKVTPTQLTEAISSGADRTLTVAFDLNSLVAPHEEGAITLNGIEAGQYSNWLITVDMMTGDLFNLNIATGKATKVQFVGGSLLSADGLMIEKNKMWVAQFGTNKISRLLLNSEGTSALVESEATDASLMKPTTIVRKDGSIHVVRSQFGLDPTTLPFTVGRISSGI